MGEDTSLLLPADPSGKPLLNPTPAQEQAPQIPTACVLLSPCMPLDAVEGNLRAPSLACGTSFLVPSMYPISGPSYTCLFWRCWLGLSQDLIVQSVPVTPSCVNRAAV